MPSFWLHRKTEAERSRDLRSLYERYLQIILSIFATATFIYAFYLLYIFGNHFFKSNIIRAKLIAQNVIEKKYTDYLYSVENDPYFDVKYHEILIFYKKMSLDEIKTSISKSIPEIVILEETDPSEKDLFFKEKISFEPFRLTIYVGYQSIYIIKWYVSKILLIFIAITSLIIVIYYIHRRMMLKLSSSLEVLSTELKSGKKISKIGIREFDELIETINDAMEREKKIMEDLSVQQKQIALGTLAGGYAHEFNNILQILSLQIELIEKYIAEQKCEFVYQNINRAKQILLKGQNLAQRLLYFSKKTETEITDIAKLLRDLEETLRILIPRDISFNIRCHEESICVKISEEGVKEVLINLVKNAIDAIEERENIDKNFEKKIEISLYKEEEKAILEVRDTGVGMKEEIKSRLFEPFFTTKPRGKGTGLGLFTVYNIVSNAEGRIAVESEYLKGTVFRVILPVCEEKVTQEIVTRESAPVLMSQYRRVLIVDDEVDISECIAQVLREMGVEADSAPNAKVAWELLQKKDYDLIFLDVYMPERGGDWLISKIEEENLKAPPIVLMTGYAGEVEDTIKEALNKGLIVKILRKPFSIEEVTNILMRGFREK